MVKMEVATENSIDIDPEITHYMQIPDRIVPADVSERRTSTDSPSNDDVFERPLYNHLYSGITLRTPPGTLKLGDRHFSVSNFWTFCYAV